MKHLPNLMTCGNLFCGCLALVSLFHDNLNHAAIFILLAALLDVADGFTARLLGASSPIGKQLDSLADMVTFGVVPGVILFHLMLKSDVIALYDNGLIYKIMKYLMFSVTVFSCIRLANFNIDERQTNHFIGLPTPANTLFILSLPFIKQNGPSVVSAWLGNSLFLVGIAVLSSWLLVANIPLLALKFNKSGWKSNRGQLLLIVIAACLIPLLKFAAIPVLLLMYIIISVIFPPMNDARVS